LTVAAVRLPRVSRIEKRRWTEGSGVVHRLGFGVLLYVVFHLAVGPVFYEIRQFAVLHALIVSAIGFWWAISRDRPLEWVAYAAAYITGAEVLWRVMRVSGPVLFYEFAKYLMIGLFILALVVRGRLSIRGQFPAVGYFALMVPSVLLTLTAQEFAIAREDISFNLSGPLTLAIAAVFFGQINPDRLQRRTLLLAIIGPILSVATAALTLILTRDEVVFGTESSKAASAHFGPNQVSAVLGLAALAALFSILEDRTSKGFKALMFVLMGFLLIQSSLTYSRGGLYTFAGASLIGFLCLFKDGQTRLKVVVVGILLLALADYVVIPRLDEWTGGTLVSRFQDTDVTGRDVLVQSELEIWAANPILGVGPGQAMYHRDVTLTHVAAHTEFSRAMAEHGLLGAGSRLLLAIMIVRTLRGGATPEQKAFALSGWAWSCLFMLTAGMRVVAPAFLVGFSATTHVKRNTPAVSSRSPVRYFRQFGVGHSQVRQRARRAG
jgi:hypothetical protein